MENKKRRLILNKNHQERKLDPLGLILTVNVHAENNGTFANFVQLDPVITVFSPNNNVNIRLKNVIAQSGARVIS